ncbi:hypothetical protein DFH07DRAFT_881054 [Mycena maculata]|uniref:Uncharacterized protein n=1 Tax=Mycena maculata TaxID=230809 RepID=A0AAD7JLN9_9AGAR|nr:hypothetical protein DFH07DRAFT_881054 [Mycena maculata]
MHPTLRVLGARVHQPLIKFPGKRSWPSTPATPHAHPAAPPEFQKRFSDVAAASPSGAGKGETGSVISEFWEAPERFWRPRVRELEESEIDAVLSGGASLR